MPFNFITLFDLLCGCRVVWMFGCRLALHFSHFLPKVATKDELGLVTFSDVPPPVSNWTKSIGCFWSGIKGTLYVLWAERRILPVCNKISWNLPAQKQDGDRPSDV